MGQKFNGNVNQVAGRDIINEAKRPESQLQAEFAEHTGIKKCPKPAREWLEDLLERNAFTISELAVSWKTGAIGWNEKKNAPRMHTDWIDAAFAYLMCFLPISCMLFIAVKAMLSDNKIGIIVLLVAIVFSIGTFSFTRHFRLVPRWVVLRIWDLEKKQGDSTRPNKVPSSSN